MAQKLFFRLSLLTRITIASFVVTVGIAIFLIIGIQQRFENTALEQEANSAADQVALILNPLMWTSEMSGSLTPQQFTALDTLIRKDILHNHIVHVKIYSLDGSIIYSDEQNLIGQKFPISSELQEAINGQVGMDVSDLSKPENAQERSGLYTRLLEVYVPIRPVDAPDKILGVYELYHDLAVVQPYIDDMKLFVSLSVGFGFLFLFGILYFLVRNASRELVLRNAENSLLVQEKSRQVLDLQNAEEQSLRRFQRLLALRTIDEAIGASLDLGLTLRIFLDQATTQLQVDAADILLLDPVTNILSFAAGRGFHTDLIKQSKFRLGVGSAGRIALEEKLIHFPDLLEAGDLVSPALVAAEKFMVYYGLPLITKGRVLGVLEVFHRLELNLDPDWLEFLEGLAKQASIAIEDAQLFENLQHSNNLLSRAYDATIEGWSRALDLRDKETEGHTQRVTEMTMKLAMASGIDPAELVNIHRGALLHDIGKMGIPDEILLKPGPLTDDEWQIMRKHPGFAYNMLSSIEYLRQALEIPYNHHEKWDGSGYPRGLKGEQIPYSARLFAIVDVWDALTSDRPYRKKWPESKVREHLLTLRGTHFDPQVVDLFFNMLGPG